jgi:hypothetical protein
MRISRVAVSRTVPDVEALAQKAWRSVNKTVTIEGVTVKPGGFGRQSLAK